MYVRGPQHSITGGGSPPSIFKWGGNNPPTLPGSTPMPTASLLYKTPMIEPI